MLRYIDHQKMGRASEGWLDSHFHFSFADYCNPENIRFGVLRVLNDDLVQPGTGFEAHPHANMEIISYVIDGALTHADNMGNQRTLTRGQVQYMSAGTGVIHSEYNHGAELLRFLQVWIVPDEKGITPNYGDLPLTFSDRENRWLQIATGVKNQKSEAPIRIHADVNVYAALIHRDQPLTFAVEAQRQAYLVVIEGRAVVNTITLSMRDALEVTEETIRIVPEDTAHVLLIEMAKA
ncbi:MAG: pirin family protein [Zoogloeaceae bacterium]|jgi:redox-sensitive bicupin YhaK (pirin superfamily)|nr:pirin family protein [Zoogloeaceae bacterium]